MKKYQLDIQDNYVLYATKNISYTLLGGIGLNHLDRMRVTIKIEPKINYSARVIRHSLDLYNHDQVEKLTRKCADEFEVSTSLIREELQNLIELLEKYRLNELEQKNTKQVYSITTERKELAKKYLKSKNLIKRTNQDIGLSGVIGEETNRLIVFLVYLSRLRRYPLHIISLGASGTGKTYLQEKIADLIPEQDKIEITSLTANALYYFEKDELQNKLHILENVEVVNPYAEKLQLPFKLKKPLRTYQQYLNFIETVTFYHQYQRKQKVGANGKKYIETTKEDIEVANELLEEVLLAKVDELPKVLRDFMDVIGKHLKQQEKDCFYARELYFKTRRGRSTVHRYIKKLEKEGYIYRVGGVKHHKGYLYQLEEESSFKMDITSLRKALQNTLKNI